MSIFNYTTGKALTYNQSEYVGYYNILSGAITTGKTPSSSVLQPQDTILGNFIGASLQFNYDPVIDVLLPYSIHNIRFVSNETINANSLNVRFDKIIDNYFEIFKRCSILTNNIPTGYTEYIALTSSSSTEFKVLPTLSTVAFSLSTISPLLTSINNLLLLDTSKTNIKNIIVGTPTGYFIYKLDTSLSTVSYAASALVTDNISNNKFGNITAITTDDKDNLFIADNNNSQLYKISIASTINNSRVNLNNPRMVNVMGELEQPSVVTYSNKEVYAYDKTTTTVYVYNELLTYLRKYTNKKLFTDDAPISMDVDVANAMLYILTSKGNILKVSTTLLGNAEVINLEISLSVGESFNRIIFSKNNSNVVYISTSNNVYKLFVDRMPQLVGKFIWSNCNLGSVTNLQIDLLESTENYDYIVIYANNRFLIFKESNNFINVLESTGFKIHTKNDIFVKDEYFNNNTLNSAITKILHNHDLLVSFLQSKFVYTYANERLVLTNTSVLNGDDVIPLSNMNSYNNFVGVNELVCPQVLNRVLSSIIDYQVSISTVILPSITNMKHTQTQIITF